jgi:hypothetical protein
MTRKESAGGANKRTSAAKMVVNKSMPKDKGGFWKGQTETKILFAEFSLK